MRDQNISDYLLNKLGDYFVENNLFAKGWTFEQFVEEYKLGYIQIQ